MAKDEVQEELKQLKADLIKVRTEVADLMSALKDQGADKAGEVKRSVEDEIRARREELRELVSKARSGSKKVVDDAVEGLEDRVEQHPVGSILTAFGLGVIFAKFMDSGTRR